MAAALADITANPTHLDKYHSNPKFMLLVARIASAKSVGSKMGGVKRSTVKQGRTPPSGAVDVVNDRVVSGWASDPDYPAGPVAVLIHRNGALVVSNWAFILAGTGDLCERVGAAS